MQGKRRLSQKTFRFSQALQTGLWPKEIKLPTCLKAMRLKWFGLWEPASTKQKWNSKVKVGSKLKLKLMSSWTYVEFVSGHQHTFTAHSTFVSTCLNNVPWTIAGSVIHSFRVHKRFLSERSDSNKSRFNTDEQLTSLLLNCSVICIHYTYCLHFQWKHVTTNASGHFWSVFSRGSLNFHPSHHLLPKLGSSNGLKTPTKWQCFGHIWGSTNHRKPAIFSVSQVLISSMHQLCTTGLGSCI